MTLGYTILNGTPRLTEHSPSGDCLEIYISPAIDGTVLVAKTVVKIENGVGRVKLSAIENGTHTLALTAAGASMLLGKITVSGGTATVPCPLEIIAKVSARECALEARADALEKEICALRDAVFGKKIF